MTRPLFLTLCLLAGLVFSVHAQEFQVLSFKQDPHSTAAARFPRTDINNQSAAIIKVRTNLTGLSFGCNIGFVGDPDSREGEIWLYVSPREKCLKFMKEGYITHDFLIPDVVASGSVYLLELLGKTPPSVAPGSNLGFILLKSTPTEAEVWIDGENTFRYTPFSKALSPGRHTITLKKEFYQDYTGTVQSIADSTARETIVLTPDFGSLKLQSTPESGATVLIDGKLQDDRTPLFISKLASGEHTITLKRDLFRDAVKVIRVFSGDSLSLTIPMEPSYGELLVDIPAGSRLIIDKVEIYEWQQPVRLSEGEHLVEVQKPQHHPHSQTVSVTIGDQLPLKPLLIPITGKLSVETTPPETGVYIDGTHVGISPLFSSPLLIGTHSVRAEKEGFRTTTKTVEVTEGKTVAVKIDLPVQVTAPREKPVTNTKNADPASTDDTPREKHPAPTETDNQSTTKNGKKRYADAFDLGIDIAYAMPSGSFWKASYNNDSIIEPYNNGWGMGIDLRYIYANRFLGTALNGYAHFFSSEKPKNTQYFYTDPVRLNIYAVWLEQMVYYLPQRDRGYSFFSGGVGYLRASYGKYVESELEKQAQGEGFLMARYGWGIRAQHEIMIEVSFQYQFIFSDAGFDRQYGALNLGFVF